MKFYSIFLIKGSNNYPIGRYKDEYYLGGVRVEPLLFYRKADAERKAREIRTKMKDHLMYEDGKIEVRQAKFIPI